MEFGPSRLEDEDRQEDLGILVLFSVFKSMCKNKYSWYAQVHNTHTFYGFSVFSLTDIDFHE